MSWILDRLSPAAQRAFIAAQSEAFYDDAVVTPYYLLVGLLQEPTSGAGRLLNELGIPPDWLRQALREGAHPDRAGSRDAAGSPPATKPSAVDEPPRWLARILELAFEEKRLSEVDQVGPEHLLIALLLDPTFCAFPPGLIPGLTGPLARRAAGYPRRFPHISDPLPFRGLAERFIDPLPFRGLVERFTDPAAASERLTAAHAAGYRIESAHASCGALWVVLDDCGGYLAADNR